MALGDDNDFRMVGFRQVMRFPPQDVIGGSGSVASRDFTAPFGGNLQQPGSWSTNDLYLGDNLNQFTTNLNANNNILNNFNLNLGGGTGTAITVVNSNAAPPTNYNPIDTLRFSGAGVTVTSPGGSPTTVDIAIPGGGPGVGTTLVYGSISGAARITTGIAAWSYTVNLYSGSSVTARNLFEKGNSTTLAYGYNISPANSDRISGTQFSVQAVPNGTWVALEQTSNVDGTSRYWFGAPNKIAGSCI